MDHPSNDLHYDVDSSLDIKQEVTNVHEDNDLKDDGKLIYKISDSPPLHLTILFGFQQALLSLANQLAISLLVAEVVCASKNDLFKTRLLSSTLFMNGITTILMSTVGCRLPIFQGASAGYVIPLLAMSAVDSTFCDVSVSLNAEETILNSTTNGTDELAMDIVISKVSQLQGSLMVAGVIHFLCGATGLVGFVLRFIGPITVVTTMLLIGIYVVKAAMKFAEVNWGISFLFYMDVFKTFPRDFARSFVWLRYCTTGIAIILSVYLGGHKMRLPMWNREKGWHIIRYPLHQSLSMLIAIIVGWIVCGILTVTNVFPNDPASPQYLSRTDSRSNVLASSTWFYFPYPGQYGTIGFSAPVFVACLAATLFSILDSIGDYYACAKICHVPPPPAHAMNRGIVVEGLCSFFAGAIGCGHATSSYGGNIGAIGVTKVASRHVFIALGVIYIVFGIIGKVSATFITIPYPVLGGAMITMFGMFTGVSLSNLQIVSLSSTRNIAVLGMSIFVGLMIPTWIEQHPHAIQTGEDGVDKLLTMLLGNPTLPGIFIAIFLDNTVPGTRSERGMTAWLDTEKNETAESLSRYEEGYEIYRPWMPKKMRSWQFLRYVPCFPNPQENTNSDAEPHPENEIPLKTAL